MFGVEVDVLDKGNNLWHAKSIYITLEHAILLFADLFLYLNRRSRLV